MHDKIDLLLLVQTNTCNISCSLQTKHLRRMKTKHKGELLHEKNHLFSIITAGMLTITLLAGCGNTGSNANADTGSNTNTVQESTEDQASAVPESEAQITGEGQNCETIIVTDVRGEVEIPADPQRIVDLSGNSDILSILGYSVVGTANSDAYDYTKFPTYLEDTLQGAEILGYSMQDTMDIEAVMNLDPDLIIISTVQEKCMTSFLRSHRQS